MSFGLSPFGIVPYGLGEEESTPSGSTINLNSCTYSSSSSQIDVTLSAVQLTLNSSSCSMSSETIQLDSFSGISLNNSVFKGTGEGLTGKKILTVANASVSVSSEPLVFITDSVIVVDGSSFSFSSRAISLPVVISFDDAINQIVSNKLKSLGYTGSLQDMLSGFFGGTGALPDRENLWLVSQTGSTGPSIDLWKKHLNSLGYSGAVAEMLKQFWMNY